MMTFPRLRFFSGLFLMFLLTVTVMSHAAQGTSQVRQQLFESKPVPAFSIDASRPELLLLPSGRVVNRFTYTADTETIKIFRPFFERTKAAYEESPDEPGAMASVYAGVMSIREQASADPSHVANLLTDEELAAIVSYSEWDYQTVNGYLWGKRESPLSPEEVKLLEAKILMMLSAIHKLPKHSGLLYRSALTTANGPEQFAEAREYFDRIPGPGGEAFIFKGFMSTTRGVGSEARAAYGDTAKLLFVIESHNGHQMEALSTRSWEEEVLFAPWAQFDVLKKEIVTVTPTAEYPFSQRFVVTLRER